MLIVSNVFIASQLTVIIEGHCIVIEIYVITNIILLSLSNFIFVRTESELRTMLFEYPSVLSRFCSLLSQRENQSYLYLVKLLL